MRRAATKQSEREPSTHQDENSHPRAACSGSHVTSDAHPLQTEANPPIFRALSAHVSCSSCMNLSRETRNANGRLVTAAGAPANAAAPVTPMKGATLDSVETANLVGPTDMARTVAAAAAWAGAGLVVETGADGGGGRRRWGPGGV